MTTTKRPLSIREIQAQKAEKRKAEQHKVVIKNLTAHQTIPLQLKAKDGTNKVIGQQSIPLHPGKTVELPFNRIMKHQLDNLKRRGLIKYHETSSSRQK